MISREVAKLQRQPENLTSDGKVERSRCRLERAECQLPPLTCVCSAIPETLQEAGHSMHLCRPRREQAHWGGDVQINPSKAPCSESQQATGGRCDKSSINRRVGEKGRVVITYDQEKAEDSGRWQLLTCSSEKEKEGKGEKDLDK